MDDIRLLEKPYPPLEEWDGPPQTEDDLIQEKDYEQWQARMAKAWFPYHHGGIKIPFFGTFTRKDVHTGGFDPYSGTVWKLGGDKGIELRFRHHAIGFYLKFSNVIISEVVMVLHYSTSETEISTDTYHSKRFRWSELHSKNLPWIFRKIWDALDERFAYYDSKLDEDPMGHPSMFE